MRSIFLRSFGALVTFPYIKTLFTVLVRWRKKTVRKTAETPMNLLQRAEAFCQAGKVLIKADSMTVLGFGEMPTYYNVCHGIELSLKAFLRARGYRAPRLMTLGHDLRRCLRRAETNGLSGYVTLNADETDAIHRIRRLYLKKELEYVVFGGALVLPKINLLMSALEKIISGIRRECFEETTKEIAARKVT